MRKEVLVYLTHIGQMKIKLIKIQKRLLGTFNQMNVETIPKDQSQIGKIRADVESHKPLDTERRRIFLQLKETKESMIKQRI